MGHELNENGFFQASLHHQSQENTPRRKNPQETMTTSMEDPMAQRILKALDEHGEAFKRMGGRFTRLEESKLKKPQYVEIHDDEEEDEEWDKKDEVKYERNK